MEPRRHFWLEELGAACELILEDEEGERILREDVAALLTRVRAELDES